MKRQLWPALLLLLPVPVLAQGDSAGLPTKLRPQIDDRGQWVDSNRANAPDVLETAGGLVPSLYRRRLEERHGFGSLTHKRELLEPVAGKNADTYDFVFLGDAYLRGLRFSGYLDGFDGGAFSDIKASVLGYWGSIHPEPEQAGRWYRAAVEGAPTPNTLALVRLADYLTHMAQDQSDSAALLNEADQLYRTAAEIGDSEAARKLAERIRAHNPQDPSWRTLLEQAALPDRFPRLYHDPLARALLIVLDLEEENYERAQRRYLSEHTRGPAKADRERYQSLLETARRMLRAWLEDRGARGNPEALYQLDELTRGHESLKTRNAWLAQAARLGHVEATIALVVRLQGNDEQLQPESVPWLARLAKLSSRPPEAQALLDRYETQVKAKVSQLEALKGLSDALGVGN